MASSGDLREAGAMTGPPLPGLHKSCFAAQKMVTQTLLGHVLQALVLSNFRQAMSHKERSSV